MYLHADKALPYGDVVEVMAILKDSGVDKLGMVTDPMKYAGEGEEVAQRRGPQGGSPEVSYLGRRRRAATPSRSSGSRLVAAARRHGGGDPHRAQGQVKPVEAPREFVVARMVRLGRSVPRAGCPRSYTLMQDEKI